MSAITFVLEEIIEDLNNRGYLAQVLIASVTATFVCHIFLGEDPAFVIPSIGHLSGILYVLVIPTAGLAALAGAAFQKGTLIWRDRIKRIKRIPFFLKAAVGSAMNWLLGISVFLAIGKIGVFGLGYGDLEKMFYGSISGPKAVILVIAKLAATTAVYPWGGAGGIFSPTLFFGAAIGLAFTDFLRTCASSTGERSDSADGGGDECLFGSGRASADHFDSYCLRNDPSVFFCSAADDRYDREPSG